MSTETTYVLSSGEIYVLAGLMGYRSVFAVNGEMLRSWYPALRRRVHETVSDLERRMLVLLEPSGVVYCAEEAAQMMRCLCEPAWIAQLSGNYASGRTSNTYLLRCGDALVLLRQLLTGMYKLQLLEPPAQPVLLGNFCEGITDGAAWHAQLPIAQAQLIRSEVRSFNEEAARRIALQFLPQPDNADALLQMLSGTCRYLHLQCRQKQGVLYLDRGDHMYVRTDKHLLSLALNGDMLQLRTVQPDAITGALQAVLA